MLSRADFNALGHEDNGTYVFDLSDIRSDIYGPLIHALAAYGRESITSVAFTCTRLAECSSQKRLPQSVENSISMRVKCYFARITRELGKLIESSAILRGVHLISTDTPIEELIFIARAAQKSRTLATIEFTDIEIFDRDIEPIVLELSKTRIKTAVFKHCGLTNRCIPLMVRFAETVRQRLGKAGLTEIDLSDNEITPSEFKRVAAALNTTDVESEAERLEKENEQLRTEIDRLKGIIDEVNEKGALFIVGDGATDLVANMKQIDARLARLEDD